MTIAETKGAIEISELYKNGLHRLSGGNIIADNVRIDGDTATADVTLERDGEAEKYYGVVYSLPALLKSMTKGGGTQ